MREVCELLGIHKTRTTPGRPQSDGMVERTCRSIQAMLSSYVSQNQKDWDVYLPLLVLAYNSSLHDTTKCTPSKVMLGRELRLPIWLLVYLKRELVNVKVIMHINWRDSSFKHMILHASICKFLVME